MHFNFELCGSGPSFSPHVHEEAVSLCGSRSEPESVYDALAVGKAKKQKATSGSSAANQTGDSPDVLSPAHGSEFG